MPTEETAAIRLSGPGARYSPGWMPHTKPIKWKLSTPNRLGRFSKILANPPGSLKTPDAFPYNEIGDPAANAVELPVVSQRHLNCDAP